MTGAKPLWEPDSSSIRKTNMSGYMKWLEGRGLSFENYGELWSWSVENLEGFWGSIWKYFEVADADYPVLAEHKMPGARWFDGAELNFAEYLFRGKRDGTAIISKEEKKKHEEISWQDLERKTGSMASRLREMGVKAGDRVAAYLPNSTESVIALLACASVGAIWTCCSPDFGPPAVVDRFSQVRPKVFIGTDGYAYGGKWFDRSQEVNSVVGALPTVERIIGVQGRQKSPPLRDAMAFEDLTSGRDSPDYEPVAFDQPLWILYSSGTTGLPKPIVHGQGGILVELLKELSLHNDIRPNDRFFWFTTTGWMMWNYLVGGLLHGATIVLYDGSPSHPDLDSLWALAEETGVTFMGGSAAYFASCEKAGLRPGEAHQFKRLRGIGSTGSPLSPSTFDWVYSAVKEDIWLASLSGGTDVCTAFVGGSPTLPVYSGEIQCRCLGAKVEAYDESGASVTGQVGELVVTEPLPSMPLFLWGDEDGRRYAESYFSLYPGVWRHGDWIEITKRGTCIIFGRSDATIKRMGVRIGTSEIYRAVESLPEIADSIAVDLDGPEGTGRLILFVSTPQGKKLEPDSAARIRAKIRGDLSPRYVPDEIVEVPSVPRTLNGKKLEVPVKRLLMGEDPSKVLSRDSVADPTSLDFFVEYARNLKAASEGN